nr:hypothetical protein [Tanacetum cinerariifolium]
MAMLTVRARRFLQRTGRNLRVNGSTSMGFDMSKVECYNCHRKEHFTMECRSPKDTRKNGAAEPQRRNVPVEISTPNALVSDSEDESKTKTPQNVLSFVQPTEQVKFHRPSVQYVETSIPPATPKTAIPKPTSNGKCGNRKACFVCKSLDHLIKDSDYHEKKMAQPTARNHAQRGNHKHYARMSLPNPQWHVVPAVVLTQSKLIPINVVRPVSPVVPKTSVTRPKQAKFVVTRTNSPPRRHINRRPSPKASTFPPKVTAVKAPMVNVAQVVQGKWKWKPKCPILDHVSRNISASMTLKRLDYNDALGRSKSDKGVIDSGCLRHMTGNMSYLSDFEELNGGYVAFGGNPKGGVKVQSFSVSQMCDKKNSVLFTDTECLVLSPDFKLPDANQVLLRVPRENNMYNVNLKNIILSGYLTCLFAKATLDESSLWHRMLGHINFKTINKLVKGNHVRGLPSKVFETDNTCVACKKGKQHRASYKTKPVSSINQPLYRLHIDLFRPTFVKSLNKKSYCLVVTDDSSRVLVTKPQTKTPYKLLHGRTPSIGFMRPFGCPVTILNTLDSLGNFNGKVDENTDGDAAFDEKETEFEGRKHESEVNVSPSSRYRNLSAKFEDFSDNSINEDNAADTSQYPDDPNMPELEDITYFDDEDNVGAEADFNNFNNLETSITVSPIPTTRVHKDHPVTQIFSDLSSATKTRSMTRVAKDQGHTQEEGIDYEEVFAPVARIEAIRLFLAYASFMGFMVYQMDVKSAFLYETIKEEVYACQPPGFEDPEYPKKVYKVVKALYGLHQAPRAWHIVDILLVQIYVDDIIFGSTNKDLCKAFEKLMKDKFQMSSIGELTFFFGLQDLDGEDVDVHTYRSMIGSLMYLTSSRPDILFAVCACAHFQVTPKTSHLHAVKRIFRYLKGKPHLGLWCPKDSPFDLVAYSDSDYAGASLDRKSTTRGCQFLGCRLISWQCKKQTVIATSYTKADPDQTVSGKDSSNPLMADNLPKIVWFSTHHVAQMKSWLVQKQTALVQMTTSKELSNPFMAGSLPKTMLITFIHNSVAVKKVNNVTRLQALVDKKKVVVTEASIRDALRLDDADGVECLPNKEIFAELARMGYEKPSTKLTFYKAFFSSQDKSPGWDLNLRPPLAKHPLPKPLRNLKDVNVAGVATEGVVSAADDVVPTVVDEPSIPSPTPPNPPLQPSQDQPSTSQVYLTPPQSPQAQPQSPQPQPQPSHDVEISMNLLQKLMDTWEWDNVICDLDKTPDLSQRSPQNCPKCGHPVDGHCCQGCALLRKKFKEDLFIYCVENGILKDSSKPSYDNTNVVNALQEPLVVKQDPGNNSSQSPPQISHHCCYECGDSLEGILCHQCTCELYGNNAHYGYNCPLKVLIISNPEPCHNQTVDELPPTVLSFDPTCFSKDGNSFTYDSTSNLVHDSSNVFSPPLQPPTYSYEFCGNDSYYGHDCLLQVLSLAWETILEIELAFEDKHCQPEDIMELFQRLHNDVQNIREELTVYINTSNWDRPTICYDDDDDEDYAIAVTPSLSTEEPDNSLNQFKDFFDSYDDSTSNDDDSFSIDNIEYVEASPPDSDLVSLEVMEIVIPKVGGIDDDILLTIKDDIHCEKLLNGNILNANIEALNDNPTPSSDFMTKSSFTSLNSFLEETNTFDNSLPEFETFCFDLEEISSGSTTTHSDISLLEYEAFNDDHVKDISSGSTTTHSDSSLYDSFIFDLSINPIPPTDRSDFYEFADELTHIISPLEYDCFCFKDEPNSGDSTMDVVEDTFPTREPKVHNALPTHTTLQLNLDFILSSESLFTYVQKLQVREESRISTEIHKINLEHAKKVLNMQEEESEPAELQEVVDVVTTAKIITEVVIAASDTITAASTTISAADVLIDAATIAAAFTLTATPTKSKDKGKGILVEEPKPLKKQAQIKQDENYARELEAELNKNVDWDAVIDHVKRKQKEDNAVKRYKALKRKPQTKAQARKNMMIYLKNVAGFKMDYFKGMTYDDIRPIFEKKFNSNVAFLLMTKEQIDEEESRALKRLNESQEDKALKKQKLNEEVEELKRHLQIVPNNDDDVLTEATPLARKVPVVDYEIYNANNKPYYKIKRADGSHQLYLSFLSLLRNFDREDLEVLWQLMYKLKSGKSKKCSWSSEGQELEAVRVLWCVDNYIYYNTVDFAGREEISTYKVHSESTDQ